MAIGWARSRRHARALTIAYNELLAELGELRREVRAARSANVGPS
jgi:hypothetical protein